MDFFIKVKKSHKNTCVQFGAQNYVYYSVENIKSNLGLKLI